MKRYILLVFMLYCSISAQSKFSITISGGYGQYISNAENSMSIMNDDKFKEYLVYGINLRKDNVYGMNLMLEYDYHKIKKDVKPFVIQNGDPYKGDVSLTSHIIDFTFIRNAGEYLSCGVGPSFIYMKLNFNVPVILYNSEVFSIYDNSSSTGLGINAFLGASFPLSTVDEHFFINAKFKFRYERLLWFENDEETNKHEYIIAQAMVGVGYSF